MEKPLKTEAENLVVAEGVLHEAPEHKFHFVARLEGNDKKVRVYLNEKELDKFIEATKRKGLLKFKKRVRGFLLTLANRID